MTKKQTPEGAVLAAVCQYLETRGYTFWRVNNTPIYDPTRQIFRAMPKYCRKGVSDIILLIDGKAYFIEVKAPGKKPSPDQVDFALLVRSVKCQYYVIHSVEELQAAGF